MYILILSNVCCGFWKGYSAQDCLIVLIEKCCKFEDKAGFSDILMRDL